MKKNFLFLLLLLLAPYLGRSQSKYFIEFTDKKGSDFSIEKPREFLSERAIDRRMKQDIRINTSDLPVSTAYIQKLKDTGASVIHTSKWLNGALIEADNLQLSSILTLPFVKELESKLALNASANSLREKALPATQFKSLSFEEFDPGTSRNQLEMLEVDLMHKEGFTGKGVLIGILDSGFRNGNELAVFRHIFEENRIIDTWDYVENEANVYDDHSHGTKVWSCIGAKKEGELLGTAPGAQFALYTTENVSSETKLEEVNWLFAAERADSLGVDVINSSLGYSQFDNNLQNYRYEDLDGDTPLITKAADFAAAKGIIIVTSAGNYGNSSWEYIGAPADGDSVLAVGAVDEFEAYVSFSSRGPRIDGIIKPEIVAKGSRTTVASHQGFQGFADGTSFSSPLIAGMMANLVQAFPSLSAMSLRDIIIKSASQFDFPDSELGFGVPKYSQVKNIATLEKLKKTTESLLLVYPNPALTNDGFYLLVNDDKMVSSSFTIEVYDVLGNLLYSKDSEQSLLRIKHNDISATAGTYIVKVFNQKGGLLSKRISFR